MLGFTLIELLVVLAIIATIAGILFPVFSQAKLSARKAENIGQLRQLGTATFLYSDDNDEFLPTWNEISYDNTAGIPHGLPTANSYWDTKLLSYVDKKTVIVNQDPGFNHDGVWHSPMAEEGPNQRSYGMNQMLVFSWTPTSTNQFNVDSYAWRFLSLGSIDASAKTILLGDGGREGRLAPPRNWDGWSDKYDANLGFYRREAPWRYGNSAGYIYADGHAKYLNGDKLYPSPKLQLSASVTLGLDHCSIAESFAPINSEKIWHQQIASAEYGVTCP